MQLVRFMLALIIAASLVMPTSGPVAAGGPPDRGVMEPVGDACPWPDFLNAVLEAGGVEKCLPKQVAWTEGEGIRIVTDPLVGTAPASGWVQFWCETKVGFRYIIGVEGLAANAVFTVNATDELGAGTFDLGTIHTNADGVGQTGGVLQLPPGFYEFDVSVKAGATEVVGSPLEDMPGFVVFP